MADIIHIHARSRTRASDPTRDRDLMTNPSQEPGAADPLRKRVPEPGREPEPLWREVLGRTLRASREELGGRLVDVAERAGISPQYLSEIERGLKEPSSEMIAAVAGALGVDLADLLAEIAGGLRRRPNRRPKPDFAPRPDAGTKPTVGTQPNLDAKALLTRFGPNTHRPADPMLLAA